MIDKINAKLRPIELLKDVPKRCSTCQFWKKRSQRMGECAYWINTVKMAIESQNPIIQLRTHRKDLCVQWEMKEGLR